MQGTQVRSLVWEDSVFCEATKPETVNYPALGNNNGSDGSLLIFALTFLFSRQQKIEGEAGVCLLITEF